MTYLTRTLTFNTSKIYYTDTSFGGEFEVMMDWEDSLMSASAAYVCENGGDILEIGYGMGISAGYIQSHSISSKSNVNIITSSWYDVKDSLSTYDGIFYDTFGDQNMKNFSSSLSNLANPGAKTTWWNNNITETNYYNIPNVNYQAITVDPPSNSYFNNTVYYLPKKEF